MATRQDLPDWVVSALNDQGGMATIVQIAKHIWEHHERDLRAFGDIFFTWQYDMRWAATKLRDKEILTTADASPKGVWALRR